MDSIAALEVVGLKPLALEPKEALSLVSGTSVLTAMAAHCIWDATRMLNLAVGIHSLYIQALCGSRESVDPFVHALKPHPGQLNIAQRMFTLLEGSQLVDNQHPISGELMQDRCSIRCLAQNDSLTGETYGTALYTRTDLESVL
jgi:phenylalanine ammonia-lyase